MTLGIKKDILHGNLTQQILLLTIPMTGSYLLQQAYQFADSIVLGRFAGVEALAAIGGSATMIINVILNIITGIATGVMIIVAQNYGRGNVDEVKKAVKTGIFVAITFGALITVVGCISAKPLLTLMKCPEETMSYSLIYLYLYLAGIIPYTIYTVGNYILRATGETKISLFFVFVIAITKIIFDLLLTAILKMGIWGVAISTFLSYVICGIIVLLILHKSLDIYQYTITDFGFDLDTMKNIFKIGVPVAIQSALFAITSAIMSIKINEFGTNTVAAFGAFNNVDNFYWSFSNAIGAAILTIAGQNYGNKNIKRVKENLRKGIVIGIVASILIGAFEFFCGKYIFNLFTTDKEVVAIADEMLKFVSVTYVSYVLVEIISGTIKGCGDSFNSMIIALIGVCAFRIAFLTLNKFTNPVEVIACYPLSWILTSIIYLLYYLVNKKYRLSKTN